MSHRKDYSDDASRTDGGSDRLGLSQDIEESFDIYDDFGAFDDTIDDGQVSGVDSPEDDLFADTPKDKSLTHQAKEDTEMVTKGTLGGARIDFRDRVVPVIMWLLLGSAFVIAAETAIDYAGPSAGPIWNLNQYLSANVLVPLLDLSGELSATAGPLLEHNLLVAGVLAVVGFLIFRNRRR